jgi:hypothetical protein
VKGKFQFRNLRIWLWKSVALTMWHPLFAKVGTSFSNSGGRSVGIACSQTKAMEFSFSFFSFSGRRVCNYFQDLMTTGNSLWKTTGQTYLAWHESKYLTCLPTPSAIRHTTPFKYTYTYQIIRVSEIKN